MRMLAGLRNAIEERHDARLQRTFGTDDQQPIFFDQLFKKLRGMAQVVRGGTDVGADGVTHQRIWIQCVTTGKQGLHGRTDAVDNRPRTHSLAVP